MTRRIISNLNVLREVITSNSTFTLGKSQKKVILLMAGPLKGGGG